MTRKECLEQAAKCVLKDRNNAYGGPEDSFGVIANFWSVYLGRKVYPHDVAAMMGLLKIARLKANPAHLDSVVDWAGYAACFAECASGKPASKAEGCEELVRKDDVFDAPQTKEELFNRIVDCNPATFHAPSYAEEQAEHYGRAHKPTGEDLAEMAEEEKHG